MSEKLPPQPPYGIRALADNASGVIRAVQEHGPATITRRGEAVAMIVPIPESIMDFGAFVMAHVVQNKQLPTEADLIDFADRAGMVIEGDLAAIAEAEADLAAGSTVSFDDVFAEDV